MTPQEDLRLHHLSSGLMVSFRRVIEQARRDPSLEIGDLWAEFVASHLPDSGDMALSCPPMENYANPWLPFEAPHVLRAEHFSVARGGMLGGPVVDVLLQVWIDSEDLDVAFGAPLMMRRVPDFGPMPEADWLDLRETARELAKVTPSGQLIFVSEPGDFDLRQWPVDVSSQSAWVTSAHTFAGTRRAPRGWAGTMLDHLVHDLASGRVGDPALSGRTTNPSLDMFLSVFHVSNVLRIKIERVSS